MRLGSLWCPKCETTGDVVCKGSSIAEDKGARKLVLQLEVQGACGPRSAEAVTTLDKAPVQKAAAKKSAAKKAPVKKAAAKRGAKR